MSMLLKPVRFETLEVGEVFEPLTVEIDRSFVLDAAFALDDLSPFTSETTPALRPGDPVNGAYLLGEMLRLLNTHYDPHHDRGLHQREEVWFHRAPRIGETVRLEGEIVDKYVRRDRPYFVVDARAIVVGSGELLLRHRATETSEIGDPSRLGSHRTATEESSTRRIEGRFEPARVVAEARPRGAWTAGDMLSGPVKDLRQSQIAVYSNVAAGWRTTHTDIAVAAEEGLDTTLAQGLMGACYITELMRRHLPEWDTAGRLNVAFVKPMLPGDRLVARAANVGRSDEDGSGQGEPDWEVWVENAAGEKTVVGWAGLE